jgi:hypothetical protein
MRWHNAIPKTKLIRLSLRERSVNFQNSMKIIDPGGLFHKEEPVIPVNTTRYIIRAILIDVWILPFWPEGYTAVK